MNYQINDNMSYRLHFFIPGNPNAAVLLFVCAGSFFGIGFSIHYLIDFLTNGKGIGIFELPILIAILAFSVGLTYFVANWMEQETW